MKFVRSGCGIHGSFLALGADGWQRHASIRLLARDGWWTTSERVYG